MFAHRLVALAFLGSPPDDRPEVAHINGLVMCNHWSNLRYSSRDENVRDSIRHGTFGSKKLTEREATEIRSSTEPVRALARRFRVSWHAIRSIRHDQSYRDAGRHVEIASADNEKPF